MEKVNISLLVTVFIFIFVFITTCESQKNTCAMKETCGACIRELGCVWCNNPFSENSTTRRCGSLQDSLRVDWCGKNNIVDPQPTRQTPQNIALQTASTGKAAVQISPQRVKLTLRRGQEYNLKFKYAQAEDYPVDLYYIMDLSASMEKHRDKLSQLGSQLADTMKKLTKNFRLGFGSFVDKVEMPFVSTVKEKLISPCKLKDVPCAPPYSFKNHLSLTEETEQFTHQVRTAKVSGNLDSPEGGLDAMMQAMVCQKEIGWRSKARHLLVFSTDAGFHIAGDGKLAGIVHPHDGKCYMKDNLYTHALELDYPSIGQINTKAIEHNINVIFAVEDKQTTTYTSLKDRIKEASIGTLSGDGGNVVDLVKDVYSKIVDSVKITDTSDSNIEIKYYSACRGIEERETKECKNLTVGVQVDFRAVIKVVNCPENENKTKIFEIKPGALNESLIVEVEMICDCECEKQGINQAPECHDSGSLQCGICSCDFGKFGSNCECDGQNSTLSDDFSSCRITNTSDICSGLGTCKCNKCDCQHRTNGDEQIYGKFCECNNYSCKRIRGLLCSGPTHGRCDCGKCICYADFEGEACECPANNNTCMNSDQELCSGHGDCVCGQCSCHLVDGYRYSGQYCEECPTCGGKLCDELKNCVECKAYQTGIYDKDECSKHCKDKPVQIIENIEDDFRENEKRCFARDKENCMFYYKYSYDVSKILNIYALTEKDCRGQIDILALILGIIGSILLAGIILLLLWKGFTTIHDRREYAKFENERKGAQWNRGENPLFKNPTTTFKNPTFSSS